MAINKFMRLALKVLSYPDIDIRKTYPLERSIRYLRLPALLPKDRWQDHTIVSEGRKILTRIYTPEDNTGKNTLLFFHGGGWVTESIDTYNKAVSYTHLDVYKRQPLYCGNSAVLFGPP